MDKKNKIGLIGHTAEGIDMFDGQTVSTRLWKNELCKQNEHQVYCVDTYNYKKRILKVLWHWIVCMFVCDDIVIMLSGNGLRFFLPLLYYANKLFNKRIYHRVIGGNLEMYINKYPQMVRYLNAFEVNWVQSPVLVERLKKQGVLNSEYLENFRRITPIDKSEILKEYGAPYMFCTFCRVSKAKGITVAADAIAEVNKRQGRVIAKLHIYGPIAKEYQEEFENILSKYKEFVEYKGSVPSSEAVSVLKNYYMHLFPTTWDGEGFPGTLIDCYNAALPTIASNWAYNTEFIEHEENGYIYDWKCPEQLTYAIEEAIKNEDIYLMRIKCLQQAEKYSADTVIEKVFCKMGI